MAKYLVFCCNDLNHYYTITICKNNQRILNYDSLNGFTDKQARKFSTELAKYYFKSARGVYRLIKDFPQQFEQSNDCISFMLSYIEYEIQCIGLLRYDCLECFDVATTVNFEESRQILLERIKSYIGKN